MNQVWNILNKDKYTEEGQQEIEANFTILCGIVGQLGPKGFQELLRIWNEQPLAFTMSQHAFDTVYKRYDED